MCNVYVRINHRSIKGIKEVDMFREVGYGGRVGQVRMNRFM
jgi:hypothetical protein